MQGRPVDRRCLVVAGGQAAPLLELVDAPLDGVPLLVGGLVEDWGLPPLPPRRLRLAIWSAGCGITARILRLRRCSRIAREEQALSASTVVGRVLGRSLGLATRMPAMTCVNAGASPAWPGVTTKASGRQRPSAARWIFVVRPPRDRPRAWSCGSPAGAPLTGPGGVLVGADDCGVDGDDPVQVAFGVGLGEQGGEDAVPCAVDRPHPQPAVGALPRAETLGQVHPRRAGAVLERDRVDHLPVITPPPTPPRGPVRQQRLDPRPLRVSQRHTSTNDQMIREKRPSPFADHGR